MNKSKPASLDSSFQASKGQATAAIPDDSSLMSGLVEPRPKPGGGKFGLDPAKDRPAAPGAGADVGSMRIRLFIVGGVLLVLGMIVLMFWGKFFQQVVSTTAPPPGTAGLDKAIMTETDPGDQTKGAEFESKIPENGSQTSEAVALADIAPASGGAFPPENASLIPNFSGAEQVATLTTPTPSRRPLNTAIFQTSRVPSVAVAKRPVSSVPSPAKPAVKITREQQKSSLTKPPERTDKKAPEHAAPVGPTGRYAVQLASFRNQRRALAEAARLQKRIGNYLKGRKIAVVQGTVAGQGTVWRLRAKGFAGAEARSICQRVKRLKTRCLALKLQN